MPITIFTFKEKTTALNKKILANKCIIKMLIAYISACVCHFPPIFFISLPVSGLDWKGSDALLGVCEIILDGLVDIGGPNRNHMANEGGWRGGIHGESAAGRAVTRKQDQSPSGGFGARTPAHERWETVMESCGLALTIWGDGVENGIKAQGQNKLRSYANTEILWTS